MKYVNWNPCWLVRLSCVWHVHILWLLWHHYTWIYTYHPRTIVSTWCQQYWLLSVITVFQWWSTMHSLHKNYSFPTVHFIWIVTSYGAICWGQHWLRCCRVTWQYQVITWNNVDSMLFNWENAHWSHVSIDWKGFWNEYLCHRTQGVTSCWFFYHQHVLVVNQDYSIMAIMLVEEYILITYWHLWLNWINHGSGYHLFIAILFMPPTLQNNQLIECIWSGYRYLKCQREIKLIFQRLWVSYSGLTFLMSYNNWNPLDRLFKA